MGAADAQLSVKRDTSGAILMTSEWIKDGPEGETLASRLEQTDVGIDDDGDAITSCVVVPIGDYEPHDNNKRKLSDKQKLALEALHHGINEFGKPLPSTFGLPAAVQAITIDQWRDQMFQAGVLDRQAKNPRTGFIQIKDALKAKKQVAERDDFVWPV